MTDTHLKVSVLIIISSQAFVDSVLFPYSIFHEELDVTAANKPRSGTGHVDSSALSGKFINWDGCVCSANDFNN